MNHHLPLKKTLNEESLWIEPELAREILGVPLIETIERWVKERHIEGIFINDELGYVEHDSVKAFIETKNEELLELRALQKKFTDRSMF